MFTHQGYKVKNCEKEAPEVLRRHGVAIDASIAGSMAIKSSILAYAEINQDSKHH